MASLFGTGIPLSTSGQTDPTTQLLLRRGFNQTPPRTILEGLGRVATGFAGANRQRTQQEELAQALQGLGKSGDTQATARRLLQSNSPQARNIGAQLLIQGSLTQAKTAAQIAKEKRGITNKVELENRLFGNKLKLRRAGRPSVNVTNIAENEASKLGARRADKTFTEAADQGRTSLGNVQQLKAISGLLKTIKTGPGTGAQVTIGAALAKVGINPKAIVGLDPNQIADAQTVTSLISNLAIQDIKRLGTRPTDKDMEILLQTLPSLSKLPGGNQKVVSALMQVNKRVIAKARIMRNILRKNKGRSLEGFDEAFEAWLKKNPFRIPGVNFDELKAGSVSSTRRRFNPQTGKIE